MGNVPSHASDDDPLFLNVITYNIRFNNPDDKGTTSWEYRKHGLVAILNKYAPDLLGCQEVLEDQLEFLQHGLGDKYTHVGLPREYNSQTKKYYGEYSCVFFNNEKFDLLDFSTFWLSETPDVPGSHGWDAACNRVCTWVKLRVKGTDKIIFHFNTHWDHVGIISRTKSAGLMKSRMMEQLIKSKTLGEMEPIMLVTGDFNCEPNSPELLNMFKPLADLTHDLDISLRYTKLEAQARKGPDATFTGFDFKANGKIDYIFYQDGWKGARRCRVPLYQVIDDVLPGGYAPSDHRPVASMVGTGDLIIREEEDFVIVEK